MTFDPAADNFKQLPDNYQTGLPVQSPAAHRTAPAMASVKDTLPTKSAAPIISNVRVQGQTTARQPPDNP